MFTTPCFIKIKNDQQRKEVVEWLEKIGYRNYGNPMQIIDFSKVFTTIDGYYLPYNIKIFDNSWHNCNDNYKLFKALSALRDDSDYMQWFTDEEHWELCPDSDAYIKAWEDRYEMSPHKATVDELKNKFIFNDTDKLDLGISVTLGTDIKFKFAWCIRRVNGVKCVVIHKRNNGMSKFNEKDFITAIPLDTIIKNKNRIL